MIERDLVEAEVNFFKALGDRTRMEILELLHQERELSVLFY